VCGGTCRRGSHTGEQLTINDLEGLFGRFEEDLQQSMLVRELAAAASTALDAAALSQAYLETASAAGGVAWGAVYAAGHPSARLLAAVPLDARRFSFASSVPRDEICGNRAATSGRLEESYPPGLAGVHPSPAHHWVLSTIGSSDECLGGVVLGFENAEDVPHPGVLTDAVRQLSAALHNARLYEHQARSAQLNRVLDDADVRMMASTTPEDILAITRASMQDGLDARDIAIELPSEAAPISASARTAVSVHEGRLVASFRVMERAGELRLSVEPGRELAAMEVAFAQRLLSTMSLALESRMLHLERDRMMRVREEWVADLSHDIRTPLATIRGYAELLATGSGVEESEVRREAGLIARQASAIERLVQDLQTAFKLHFSTLPVSLVSTELGSVVEEALEAALWHAGRGHGPVVLDRPDHPIRALVDPSHFSRIVSNLAINAFVHNPPETPVRALLDHDEEHAFVTIADDGLGMDPKLAARACRRGERGDRQGPGSGLGMAIVHELTQALGGQVRVDSAKGRGTSVTVSVPLANRGTGPRPAPPSR